jgi:hypothetical protein
MRRLFIALACSVVGLLVIAPLGTKAQEVESGSCASRVAGDFDVDGFDDLAVGVPGQDVDGANSAGGVHIIYGTASGLSGSSDDFITQDSGSVLDRSEAGDHFGACLVAGDFNDDGEDDLAIGVPGENIGTTADAGAVSVIYGSTLGLDAVGPPADQFIHQNTPGTPGVSEEEDLFGSALGAGDFDSDGRDDLAVGAPGEDVSDLVDAGAVNVFYGANGGLATGPISGIVSPQLWYQDIAGVVDSSQRRDEFGASLASGDFNGDGEDDLAVGVPGQRVDGAKRAGGVHVLNGGGSGLSAAGDKLWTQDILADDPEELDRFGATVASGDFDSSGDDDLAIGVPEEDGSTGAVHIVYGSNDGLDAGSDQFFTQDDMATGDPAEGDDLFGASLASADFEDDGDDDDDLAIGVPGEDGEAGAVEIVYGDPTLGLDPTDPNQQHLSQDTFDVGEDAESGDEFGHDVLAGDFNDDAEFDLAIGVPGEEVAGEGNAGLVNVIYSNGTFLDPSVVPDEFWTQDASLEDDPEAGDRFGAALG